MEISRSSSSSSAVSGDGSDDVTGGRRVDGGGDDQQVTKEKNTVPPTTGGDGATSWVVDMQKRADTINIEGEKEEAWKHSIYKVPACIRGLNKDAYTPQVVSFGPYHHGEAALAAMEEHKCRSLVHLLWRCKKPLASFVSEMKTVEQQLMAAYDGLPEQYHWRRRRDHVDDAEGTSSSSSFLKLMVVDGCFMLEVIRYSNEASDRRAAAAAAVPPAKPKYSDYSHKDPIFSWHGVLNTVPIIKRDMLMMENQLPLLVLSKLAAVESGDTVSYDAIHRLVLKFLAPNQPHVATDRLGLHLLDVYRQSLLHGPSSKSGAARRTKKIRGEQKRISNTSPGGAADHGGGGPVLHGIVGSQPAAALIEFPWAAAVVGAGRRLPILGKRRSSSAAAAVIGADIIRSATELNEAGIRFRPSGSNSLRDIHFKGGVLSLPVMVVDDLTECTFLNLMAFERLHAGTGNEVTSYVFFMDNIIDSTADVGLLNAKGIIHNAVGSDKEVARLFNTMSKDVALDPDSSLDHVHTRVNKYCRKKVNKWRANLIHTYFRNPWAALSLGAALFLLALTVAQTVFTVLQWYQGLKGDDQSPAPRPPLRPPHSLLPPALCNTSSPNPC